MNKIIVGLVILIVLAGGAFALTRSKNNTSTTNSSNSSSTSMHMPESSGQSSSSPATPTNVVKIADFAFAPANITVKKGTIVTWTNNDSTAHTVTESDGQDGPKSANVNPGQSYSFTFNTAGTYKYACSIHPSMTGTVTVTE